MSKFFAGGASDIDTEESGSDEAGIQQQAIQVAAREQANVLVYDSSSSEEEKRVVRSQKDKHFDLLKSTIRLIRASVKSCDWVAVLKNFDILSKQYDKAKNVVGKEGVPRWYIKLLVQLEQSVADNMALGKEERKKMSSSNNRSLNTIKQRLRKYTKPFQKFMDQYNANPDKSGDDESDNEFSSDDDSSEDEKSVHQSAQDSEPDDAANSSGGEFADEFGDDYDSGIGDSDDFGSSDSDSSIDLEHPTMSRDFWVKQTKDDDDGEFTKVERRRLKKPRADANKAKAKVEAVQKKAIEFTPEVIQQQLALIIAERGKRGHDREAAIAALEMLASKASAIPILMKVKITLLSALFDLNFNKGVHMEVPLWQTALNTVSEIISILEANPTVRLCEDDDEEETIFVEENIAPTGEVNSVPIVETTDDAFPPDNEDSHGIVVPRLFQQQKREKRADGLEYVAGSVYSFGKRLADEYIMSLQNIDSHSQDYLDRLADEIPLLRMLAVSQRYYQRLEKPSYIALVALLRVEFLHTKYDPACDRDYAGGSCKIPAFTECSDPLSLVRGENLLLHRLTGLVYQIGTPRAKLRSVICAVYHYAMHNHFYRARDLLLMSHVQDNISSADIATQILFNRCIAQLGVCAFRSGLVRQGLNCVADLYSTSKIKELLAQGVASFRWNQDRDLEKEKKERRRQQPYHVHISLELLETVHLVSAMLLEMPNLASHSSNDKRHIISRQFRRQWDNFNKNAFNGPPDNTRDFVVAAGVSVAKGDYKTAFHYLMQLKIWPLIPHADQAKALLLQNVKEASLRTFLLSYGDLYSNILCTELAQRFDLSNREVHSIACKLIATHQLSGSVDQPSDTIFMKSVQPNTLEASALKYADIVGIFVEQNERLMEHRHVFGKSSSSWRGREGAVGGRGGRGRGRGGRNRGGFQDSLSRSGSFRSNSIQQNAAVSNNVSRRTSYVALAAGASTDTRKW